MRSDKLLKSKDGKVQSAVADVSNTPVLSLGETGPAGIIMQPVLITQISHIVDGSEREPFPGQRKTFKNSRTSVPRVASSYNPVNKMMSSLNVTRKHRVFFE